MSVHADHSREILDRLGRVGVIAVPPTLAALGGLHAAWALGWRWPGGSDQALAERVLSRSERDRLGSGQLPPVPLTWSVAAALLAGAGIVRAAGTGTRSATLRGAAWTASVVLVGRGAVSVASNLSGGPDDTYQRLDLAIYSPLCLALGAGTAAAVARKAPMPLPNRRLALAGAATALLGGGLSVRTAAQAMAAGRLPL